MTNVHEAVSREVPLDGLEARSTDGVEQSPSGLAYWTPVRVVWAVVVFGIALRAWVTLSGYWYWDDYVLLGRATRLAPDLDFVTYIYDGHAMPGGWLLAWAVGRAAGMSYLLPAAVLILAQALAIVLFAKAALEIIGRRWSTAVAVTVLAVSPLTLASSVWWSTALNVIPFQIGLTWAVLATTRWVRTGRAHHGWGIPAATAVTLLFYENAVLIPLVAFLLLPALTPDLTVTASWRRWGHKGWRIWSAAALLVAAYLVWYTTSAQRLEDVRVDVAGFVEMALRSVVFVLSPAAVGGPWTWLPVGSGAALAAPPFLLAVLALQVTGALALASSFLDRRARRAWLWLAASALLSLVLTAMGRFTAATDALVVQGAGYLADMAVPLALCVGVSVAVLGPRSTSLVRVPGPGHRTHRVLAGPLPVLVLVVVLVVSSSVSAVSFRAIWRENLSRGYIESVQAAVEASPRTVLLDQVVPSFVLDGLAYPYNLATWLLSPLEPAPVFRDQTEELLLIGEDGSFVPATVVGPGSTRPPDACGWKLGGRSGAFVDLSAQIVDFGHTVAMSYVARADTTVRVKLASGEWQDLRLTAGRNEVYLRTEGGGRYLRVVGTEPVPVCIRGVTVGQVVPTVGGNG
jgi:hypothetical protein